MNQKVKSIAETMEKASQSRISLEDAEQQIRRISSDSETQSIKTNALQILSKAKSAVASHANDKPVERLKTFRREGAAMSKFAQTVRTTGGI
jgi:hypothetical protein